MALEWYSFFILKIQASTFFSIFFLLFYWCELVCFTFTEFVISPLIVFSLSMFIRNFFTEPLIIRPASLLKPLPNLKIILTAAATAEFWITATFGGCCLCTKSTFKSSTELRLYTTLEQYNATAAYILWISTAQ